ncbi:hypothetical protein BDQ17DRAFT_245372 [Cyathus striatus]|nr:hypothetical protein BDQ17DRAFT_245372 [Cyathus striatus]
MCQEGVIVGTSESVAFQLMGDASLPTFKAFSQFVKDEKESSKTAGEILLQGKHGDNKTADGEIVGEGSCQHQERDVNLKIILEEYGT